MFINTVQFLSIASSNSLSSTLQTSRRLMLQNNKRNDSHLHIQEFKDFKGFKKEEVEIIKKPVIIDICTPLGLQLPEQDNASIVESNHSLAPNNISTQKVDNNPQFTINVLEELKSVMKKCKDLRESQNTSSSSMKNNT